MLFEQSSRIFLRLYPALLTLCLLIAPAEVSGDTAIEDALSIGELAESLKGGGKPAIDSILPLDCGRVPARGINGLRSSLVEYAERRLTNKLPSSGSYDAKIGEFPPFVSIHITDHKRRTKDCSGVILNKKFVLSTASCLENAASILIFPTVQHFVAAHGTKKVNASFVPRWYKSFTYCQAREYDKEWRNHDFAVIKLNQSMEFNEHVQPICLPSSRLNNESLAYSVGLAMKLDPSEPSVLEVHPVKTAACDEYKPSSLNCFAPAAGHPYTSLGCRVEPGSPVIAEINGRLTLFGLSSEGPCELGRKNFSVNTDVFSLADSIRLLLQECSNFY